MGLISRVTSGPLSLMKNSGISAGFFIRLTGVTLLYFASAQAGLMYAVVGSTVTLVWPPSGIALVAILTYGYRISFGIALGAILANAWTGLPIPLAAGIAIGNVLEAIIGVYLLKRLARFQNRLERRRDVFALIILAATCSTMISAFVGAFTLTMGGIISFGEYASVWLKWWLGDMMGVLVVAPPLLIFLNHPRPVLSWMKTVEAVGLFTILLVVSYMIFATPQLAGHGYYPASLAIFPFVIWGALRFDHWGATLVTLLISILAIWGTVQGAGPFAVDSSVDSLVGWCIFVNVVAITGLLLAAFSSEQHRSQADIKSAHDKLEQRVKDRTHELVRIHEGLQQEIAERKRLEVALIQVSEAQQKRIGQELHDGLGQHLTSIAFFGATLQQKLNDQAHSEADAAQRVVELVNQSIEMTRRVARGLYPAVLEFRGLPVALEQLADNTRSLTGITCVVHADPDARVSDPLVAINLYRVAQEAINNAVKHSHARHITITLACINGNHRLSVSDDGIGFDPKLIVQSQGLGMNSLRFRASLLGGDFEIVKNTQGGTTVAVIYPAQRGRAE